MRRGFLKRVLLVSVPVMVATLFLMDEAVAQKKLRLAALLPGSIADNAFNAMAFKTLNYLKEKYGVEFTYQERVPPPEFEASFIDLAKKGYDVIWGHGFQFTDAAKKVAGQFPNVRFIVTETYLAQPPNFASLQSHYGQLGFLAGAFAGLMTKKNAVGVIGAIPIPVITEYMDNFLAGAKYVNPKVKGMKAYNGSLEDVASGKQTALAMIDQGADIVAGLGNENITGVILAAKERKVFAIGGVDDQYKIAPDTVMVSAVTDFRVGIGNLIENIIKGKFEAKNYVMTLGKGVTLSPFHQFEGKVPKNVRDRLKEIERDIVAGKIKLVPQPKAP